MGRNNKRIKQQQEAINKVKIAQQQQQQFWNAAAAAAVMPTTPLTTSTAVNLGTAHALNPYQFLYPQAFFAPHYAFQQRLVGSIR